MRVEQWSEVANVAQLLIALKIDLTVRAVGTKGLICIWFHTCADLLGLLMLHVYVATISSEA